MPGRLGRGRPFWWHGKFKGCGYKITAGRDAIIEVLSKADKHLSAEDIYLKVHSVYPGVGLTTVYRTLEILVNVGLVYKFDFGDGRARYELSQDEEGEDHHHHLICKKCNRVIDYSDFIEEEAELLNKTEKGLSKKYNFEITGHLIQFYGLCEKCANRK
ncbi:MAG: transcriptional repressor [Endomicrobiales bacterium]|nr:transcriptional repressor [Endomicrobiales bacterium]